jgi:hypothetical protein
MRTLKPWAYGPFEILLHAEMHYRAGEDTDRRIAMIGFDNAIEVAVTTYLNLHPIQRGNRTYPRTDVERWLGNFHTKIEFLQVECATRAVTLVAMQDEIIWFHEVRNGQYHGGGATVPQSRELDGVRAAAIEIIALLFELPDIELALEEHIAERTPPVPQPRNIEHDRLIDCKFGMVEVCGQMWYSSEVLYGVDSGVYRETAIELATDENVNQQGGEE